MTTEALTGAALADEPAALNRVSVLIHGRAAEGGTWSEGVVKAGMAEIVNLRRARKARQRREDAQTAAENRARFGLSRSAKERAELEKEREARLLDGARRTPGAGPRDET